MSPAAKEILDVERQLVGSGEKLKELQKELQDILVEHTAFNELEKAKQAVERAREGLKNALMGDASYNNKLEEIADERENINALRSTISSMLVAYFAETQARELEVDNTTSRDIELVGKLGKPHRTQLKIFGGAQAAGKGSKNGRGSKSSI